MKSLRFMVSFEIPNGERDPSLVLGAWEAVDTLGTACHYTIALNENVVSLNETGSGERAKPRR
jgi:hypothetical protein